MSEEKPQKTKVIEIDLADLHIVCSCRKVSMIVKGAKADIRKSKEIWSAMRTAMELCCGCKSMLANTGAVRND